MEKDIKRECFAERTVATPVEWGAVVRVAGEDAAEFLQGQFSQELREGRAAPISYGFWLSRTGKVEGDAWVVREGSGAFVVLSRSMTAARLIERLEHFIIADDVVLSDETDAWSAWWLAGDGAADVMERLDGSAGWVLSDPIPIAGTSGLWVGKAEPDWGEGVVSVDEAAIERLRVLAGVPRVPIDIGPSDLPQEGGLARIGVSFNKGCYLGQEVMARVQNTGRVRRRLIQVTGEALMPAGTGEAVMLGDRVVGSLRSRVRKNENEWVGLAMVSEGVERAGGAELTLAPDGLRLGWREISERA